MPGERRTIGSFPEVFHISQGSSSRSSDMAQQTSSSDMFSPVDNRFPDCMITPHDPACENAEIPNLQSFNGMNAGESSSKLDFQSQICDDRMKVEDCWPDSFLARPGTSLRVEERQFESNDLSFSGRSNTHVRGNQLRRDLFHGSSSSHVPQNVNFSMGYLGTGANFLQGMNGDCDGFKSHEMEMEQTPSAGGSFDNVGPSAGNSGFMVDADGSESSSLGNLGASCKRKALEGSSSSSCSGGSSRTLLDAEDSAWANNLPSSSSMFTLSQNSPNFGPPVFQNPRARIASRGMASDSISLSRSGRSSTNPLRNFGRRTDNGQHLETLPLNLSSTGTTRISNFSQSHNPSRSEASSDALELRLTAGGATSGSDQSQSTAMNAPGLSANFRHFAWGGSSNAMVDSLPNPHIPRERAFLEEPNPRISTRNYSEHTVYVPVAEMRNSGNDSAWNVAAGSSSSGGLPSTIWGGSSSNFNPFPAPSFVPPNNVPSHNQRLSDVTPWSLFPSIDSDSGVHNGHFSSMAAGPSNSSQDSIIPNRSNRQGHHQTYPRSSFSMERRGSGIPNAPHSLRGLVADIEGRRRLISEIRQVLNAMRRGENFRAERALDLHVALRTNQGLKLMSFAKNLVQLGHISKDYMLFDPLIYQGMAEMHDRHRDMRLDVDNMSYEELLALEERIGDVSTGLSEDAIMKSMKQRKYESSMTNSSSDIEPCCICQEEYADGEDLGSLECGHDFHMDCIKQWLMQKNLCPICKTTALNSG